MADFLGMAWRVLVIGLIVAAVIAAIAAGTTISNQMRDLAGSYGDISQGGAYSNLSLVKPLLESLTLGQPDRPTGAMVWTALLTLAAAIPTFAAAVLGVRWLIRVGK